MLARTVNRFVSQIHSTDGKQLLVAVCRAQVNNTILICCDQKAVIMWHKKKLIIVL